MFGGVPHSHTGQKRGQLRIGVLLVHGLNGCRRDMEEIAELITHRGMTVENMLLPGHGTDIHDMLPLGWFDWSRAVHREVQQLKQICDLVFLIGHSLGGALCLHTAASEQIAGIVVMCAPLQMFFWTKYAVRFAKYFTPLLPTLWEDICDSVARKNYARSDYHYMPLAPLDSLLNYLPTLYQELPRITAPALIINAKHDHVVPARDGVAIYRMLGSQEKELLTLRRSYHVVMKDHEHQEVFARILTFLECHIHL